MEGRKYELVHDEGRDSWDAWGESREDPAHPWHLVIRVEYPDGIDADLVYSDYLDLESVIGDWMRELEGRQLKAVITDSGDWSTYQGGRVRTVPA